MHFWQYFNIKKEYPIIFLLKPFSLRQVYTIFAAKVQNNMLRFIANILTLPLFYILLPLVVGLIVKRRKIKRIFYGIAIALALFFTNPWIIQQITHQWYQEYDHPIADKEYTYGIVLGGYSDWDWDRGRIEFSDIADRLTEGIRLYKLGKIKKLVLASDGSITETETDEGFRGNPKGVMQTLTLLGIPEEDIIMETKATTTRENATLTLKLIGNDLKEKPSLLITSATHMRRSLLTFNQEGLFPDPYITDTDYRVRGKSIQIMPSINALVSWRVFLHEFIGYWAYKTIA